MILTLSGVQKQVQIMLKFFMSIGNILQQKGKQEVGETLKG